MSESSPPRRPAAFFDRDGVLIEDTGYPYLPSDVSWTSGVFEAITRLNLSGYLVFVVTNQAGVARGYFPESKVVALHHWMAGEFQSRGARVDAWTYCPHHPAAAVADYRRECRRRKPRPGMIEDLMATWPIDPAGSFLVGDRETDLAAAAAAGVSAHQFSGGALDVFLETVGRLVPDGGHRDPV